MSRIKEFFEYEIHLNYLMATEHPATPPRADLKPVESDPKWDDLILPRSESAHG